MGTISWGHLLAGELAAIGGIVLLMALVLTLSLKRSNWSIIDTFWGLGFVVVAWVSWLVTTGAGDTGLRLLALVIPTVWGIRLAGYLHWRNRGKPEDPRYSALIRRRTGRLIPYVIRQIFWAQGSVMWVTSIPITVAMVTDASPNALTWIGAALGVFGIVFETVGDLQLARFRANPDNAGKIMDRGLWAWTRHPNYFGDLCVMFSFWVIAASTSWLGVATIFAPILMTWNLLTKTGRNMLDRHMARTRGQAYVDYAARTSGLIPRPPRRDPNPTGG